MAVGRRTAEQYKSSGFVTIGGQWFFTLILLRSVLLCWPSYAW
jgi:hypothetical protein